MTGGFGHVVEEVDFGVGGKPAVQLIKHRTVERVVPVGQLETALPGRARTADQLVVVRQLIGMNPDQRNRRRSPARPPLRAIRSEPDGKPAPAAPGHRPSQIAPQPANAARKKKVGRKSRTPSCAGVSSIRITGKVRKWMRK